MESDPRNSSPRINLKQQKAETVPFKKLASDYV